MGNVFRKKVLRPVAPAQPNYPPPVCRAGAPHTPGLIETIEALNARALKRDAFVDWVAGLDQETWDTLRCREVQQAYPPDDPESKHKEAQPTPEEEQMARRVCALLDTHRGCVQEDRMEIFYHCKYRRLLLPALLCRCDVRSMDVLSSLVHFLHWLPLKLPGEASIIDCILTAMAEEYVRQNASCELSADKVQLLYFCIIMLHTDIWDPRSKHPPMTEAQFLVNLRGMDIPEDILLDIYSAVRATPLPAWRTSARGAVPCECPGCVSRRRNKLAVVTIFAMAVECTSNHKPPAATATSTASAAGGVAELAAAVRESFAGQSHYEPRLLREIFEFL